MIFVWVFVITSNFASAYTGHRHEFEMGRYSTGEECDAAAREYKKSEHYRLYGRDRDLDMRLECRRVQR